MKVRIEKKILLEGLQKVLGPTTTKQNFPVLNCVLIETKNNLLYLISTDLDITITKTLPCETQNTGKTLVPMKRFISIVKELPEVSLTLEQTENNFIISCENIEYKINTLNPKEFPLLEKEKAEVLIKLNPQELLEALELTSFSVSTEETRFVLNGILFELLQDEIKLVSSDGRRLSYVRKKLPPEQSAIVSKIQFILPIKTVYELQKNLNDYSQELFLATDSTKVKFDFQDMEIISRLIEGEFPNYNQYIPQSSSNVATIDRLKLLSALKRIEILSTPEFLGVRFILNTNTLVITKSTPQLGEAKEILEMDYKGEKLEIGFNPNFLIDVLKVLTEEKVKIEFLGQDKPAVIRKESYIHLVLPMRI